MFVAAEKSRVRLVAFVADVAKIFEAKGVRRTKNRYSKNSDRLFSAGKKWKEKKPKVLKNQRPTT